MMTWLGILHEYFQITFNGKTIFDTMLNISLNFMLGQLFMSGVEPFFLLCMQ